MVSFNSFPTVLFLLFTAWPCTFQQWFPNDTIPSREAFYSHPSFRASQREPFEGKNPSHPQSTVILDCSSVQYYLVTRNYPNGTLKACNKQKAELFNGKLNVTKPTRILVHGWKNSRETSFTQNLTKTYLEAEDVNVVQVDWSADAMLDYFTASYRAPEVGQTLADFIQQMVTKLKLDLNNLHLVGFSLGAHVVGVAGYALNTKVARVIGLDPAGPFFEFDGPERKLSKESGQFVMTLHTCALRLGTSQNLGHLNFNANSGMAQPGCEELENFDILGYCSHNRAPPLFASSILHPNGFLAVKCDSYITLKFGFCEYNPTTYFTSNADRNTTGTYFFRTTSSYPYIIYPSSERLIFRTNQTESVLLDDKTVQSKKSKSRKTKEYSPIPINPRFLQMKAKSKTDRKSSSALFSKFQRTSREQTLFK